jgi:hypothetical protein
MSTSPVSFGSSLAQSQGLSAAQQITQDFKQLAKSLQSGDLGGAQAAYLAIQKLLPNQPQNSQETAPASNSNPIAADFKALGQALQSGDLGSAQSAFSQLQNDLKAGAGSSSVASGLTQATRHHHGHHAHAASTQDSDSSSSTGQIVNILAWLLVSCPRGPQTSLRPRNWKCGESRVF